jgi:hypothetical protein
MRSANLLFVVLLAGCAGQQTAPPPAVVVAVAATPTATPLDPDQHRVKVDATNVADVQLAGYKLVNKQGESLYCRTDPITGSRLQTRTVCLTEQQLLDQMNATKQSMEHLTSHQVGPAGK